MRCGRDRALKSNCDEEAFNGLSTRSGYEATGWQGIGAPRNTPPEIIDRLHREINACLDDPKLQARIVELGYLVFKTSQAEFSSFVAESTEKWANIIRAANIRAE